MMLNILMSIWGARIDAINEDVRDTSRSAEPQGYADDCCVTATKPEVLKRSIEESKLFATFTGLLLAGEKCHLFGNDFADRAHLEGISVSGNTLSFGNSFNCLGVSIPVSEHANGGRDPKHIKKALDRTRRIALLPVRRSIRPKIIHGFFASVWAYGCQFTNANSRSDEKIQTETKKAAGYGTHMRCAEIVDAIFLKGHVVDPEQGRPYRLVSNILNILLKNGPNKDRAIRLWQKVRPGNGGLVARTKQTLDNLNTPWTVDAEKRSFFGEVELKQDTKHEILHTIRDKLRRIKWRKAAIRRPDMEGLEDLSYEKSRALWKKNILDSHLQRSLEYVLSNAVWTRERKFRHTKGGNESSPKCKFCDSNEDETPEHIYWKCKKWEEIREKFPLARKVYQETRYMVTKACGLVLRSEDHLHSQARVAQMQWMMASVLKARHAAGKQEASENDPAPQGSGLTETIRPHDLMALQTRDGRQAFQCRRCATFRSHTTQILAQEHCDGRRKQHRRFPLGHP